MTHVINTCDSPILLSKLKDTVYKVINSRADPMRLLEEENYAAARSALRLMDAGLRRSVATRFCEGRMRDTGDVALNRIIMFISDNYNEWRQRGCLPERLENLPYEMHPTARGNMDAAPVSQSDIFEAPRDPMDMTVGELLAELGKSNMHAEATAIHQYLTESRMKASSTDCPICFEPKEQPLMCITDCKHVFCKGCIVKHFDRNPKRCPMCRESVDRLTSLA
jgi:hypothetical protein